jgi:cytochrome c551
MLAAHPHDRAEGVLMRRVWVVFSLIAVIGAAGVLTACGGGDTAQTTTQAPTTAASTAEATSEATTAAAPSTTAPTTTADAGAAAKAGLVVFQSTCTGCHMADGTEAGGVGPKLEGLGLTAAAIRNQVVNGGGAMPAGLVSGADLDSVTAYVVSIQ